MSASHACIVPTRTNYEAGFEMTCSEAILAGRPLVTSKVCPALDYLRDASIEATPDDAASYRDAIVKPQRRPGALRPEAGSLCRTAAAILRSRQ